jgi:pSer/pThr/pTyr-binding forkhead associated (FHA) protein
MRTWSTRRPGDGVRLRKAEEDGRPFLLARDADDRQRIFHLDPAGGRLTVGRAPANDIAIDWDPAVSGVHCELELVALAWMVRDSQSRNGTRVNGQRILARVRLGDGDVLHVGQSDLLFRQTAPVAVESTLMVGQAWDVELSPRQREVLIELARPRVLDPQGGVLATNDQIATALGIGVDAVKRNLGLMFEKFALGGQPQNTKRSLLVQRALQQGVITEAQFGDGRDGARPGGRR